MRVTLLGHASLLFEHGATAILMDPVFFDPFERDTVSCPKRVVHTAKLPPISAVVVSHGHRDHCDPASLRTLPADTLLFCPDDPALVRELLGLGFTHVVPVKPGEVLEVGEMLLLPTASHEEHEHGAVFAGGGVAVWNQVDTAVGHAESVEVMQALGRPPDVALCPYNPLLEFAEMWLSEDEFPRERYERLLEAAIASRAPVVVPGSSGQRLMSPREWLNHRVFPATREMFVRDLREAAPELRVVTLDPGQGLVCEGGGRVRVEQTPYAETLQDDTDLIRFAPREHPPPAPADPNVEGLPEDDLAARVENLMRDLEQRMRARLTDDRTGPLRTLWDRRAVLQIDVVLPSGARSWHLADWRAPALWRPGAHADPDYLFRYVASELVRMFDGRSSAPPTIHALRRATRPRRPGERFRFGTLDPARLHGDDLYWVVDEEFVWNPLLLLL
jgi:L-ascorbate metabolism protein UlaG (beta-lactamase superfamily)